MGVYPHPNRPRDPNWAILGDFSTGMSFIPDDDVYDWLNSAVDALNDGDWIFIRGMASHLGTDRGYDNLELSKRRAERVLLYIRENAEANLNHITLVDAIADSRATGLSDDNRGFWRSVEVIVTPRRIPPPPPPRHPKPRRHKELGSRFSIHVVDSFSGGVASTMSVTVRDDWRGTYMNFLMRGAGISMDSPLPSINYGDAGRWSTIPPDPHVRRLQDFHHAECILGSLDSKNGRLGTNGTLLTIRVRDRRAGTLYVQNFDTGSSWLPDGSSSLSALTMYRSSGERTPNH